MWGTRPMQIGPGTHISDMLEYNDYLLVEITLAKAKEYKSSLASFEILCFNKHSGNFLWALNAHSGKFESNLKSLHLVERFKTFLIITNYQSPINILCIDFETGDSPNYWHYLHEKFNLFSPFQHYKDKRDPIRERASTHIRKNLESDFAAPVVYTRGFLCDLESVYVCFKLKNDQAKPNIRKYDKSGKNLVWSAHMPNKDQTSPLFDQFYWHTKINKIIAHTENESDPLYAICPQTGLVEGLFDLQTLKISELA